MQVSQTWVYSPMVQIGCKSSKQVIPPAPNLSQPVAPRSGWQVTKGYSDLNDLFREHLQLLISTPK
jgi:hypothetical protein